MPAVRNRAWGVGRAGCRLLTLVVLALLAAACSLPAPSSTGAGPDDLVWAVGGASAAPGAVNDRIAKLYTEQDPSRPAVQLVPLPDEADLQREQMAYELQAQSPTFDVLGLDVIWTGEFAVNGWIEKLEDRRSDLEGVVLDSALESALHEEEVWAAPFNTNAGFLYYRTDLVDEPPKTWDELATMAKEIGQKEGIGGYVGQGSQYEGLVVNYLELVWGAGGELVNEDGSQAVLEENEAGQRALEFMQTALEDGTYAPGFNTMLEEEGRNTFQSGDAVFMRNWPYAYALMQGEDEENPSAVKGKFDIAPLPTFTGDGTVSALGGFNLAVNAYSEKIDQAKDFVVWAATDPEAQKMLAEDSLPPTREDVYDELSDDPVMSLLAEILPQSKPRPPVPAYNFLSQDIQQSIFPAYNGDAPVGPTISGLNAELNSQLEG
ncbi:MAG TPA: ABC transporter substrate-binding protein [Euzebyales bacterium]